MVKQKLDVCSNSYKATREITEATYQGSRFSIQPHDGSLIFFFSYCAITVCYVHTTWMDTAKKADNPDTSL